MSDLMKKFDEKVEVVFDRFKSGLKVFVYQPDGCLHSDCDLPVYEGVVSSVSVEKKVISSYQTYYHHVSPILIEINFEHHTAKYSPDHVFLDEGSALSFALLDLEKQFIDKRRSLEKMSNLLGVLRLRLD